MLLSSTADHDLDLYEVYYSPDHWLQPIVEHQWRYVGRVYEVFGLARVPGGRPITRQAVEDLVGYYQESYCFGNYSGTVTMYSRCCDDYPINLYEVQDASSIVCKLSITVHNSENLGHE